MEGLVRLGVLYEGMPVPLSGNVAEGGDMQSNACAAKPRSSLVARAVGACDLNSRGGVPVSPLGAWVKVEPLWGWAS
jgi:hypothetical protein